MEAAARRKHIVNRDTIQRYGAVLIFFALFAFNCLFTKKFFSMRIVWNLLVQATPAILVGFGMTLVIATGNIDISVGSNMGLSAVIFALLVKGGGAPFPALITAMCLGMFVGLISGLLVSMFKVQSMIVTMAGMYILRGLARVFSNGSNVSYMNKAVSDLSFYRILGAVPLHVVIVFVVLILFGALIYKTRYGICLEACGDNKQAAHLSGINTVLVITAAYMVCGTLAAFSGVEKAVMVSSADGAGLGLMYEFDAIAATVVGGTPMAGGKPNLIGTLFAGLLLQLIEIMVNMNNIYYAVSLIIKALIILLAIYAQNAGQKKQ